ncbi:MAG TPA: hypothetical protein VF618_03390 [Thermoanaerobaculia bacterium]
MDQTTRNRIRRIFLSDRSSFSLKAAAAELGVSPGELEGEVEMGAIVAGSGAGGQRVGRGELVAAAVRVWGLAAVEEALGGEAAAVLPEAVRQVEVRTRLPRYQSDMLRHLAAQRGTSVDDVLSRELEDVACAHAEELAAAVPGFAGALAWPESENRIED